MTNVNQPLYDDDLVNKAYVDKLVGGVEKDISDTNNTVSSISKNYGSQPAPPYHVNDTYMDGTNIYICINDREIGEFNPSDWELASDYTNDDVANSKSKTFTTQPVPPYRVGDLWANGPNGDLYRCINTRLSGSYVASDWENATKYDNTKVTIDGGLVTAGTIQLAGSDSNIKAGITGEGTTDNDVRIWAGATKANKGSAPFRVTQGGYLYASNANIEGTIIADTGKIGGWNINAYKLYGTSDNGKVAVIQLPGYEYTPGTFTNWVFAAGGTSHSNYGSCPFRVNKNGYLYSTAGSIGGWSISNSGLRSSKHGLNATGDVYFYPAAGGMFKLNDGALVCGPSGVLISGTGDYTTLPGNGSVRIHASNNFNTNSYSLALDYNASYGYGRIGGVYVVGGKTSPNLVFTGPTVNNNAYINSGGSGIYLVPRNNGKVYIGAYGESPSPIATSSSGPSSLCVKKNLVNISDKYDKIYDDFKQINTYDYDYKYKNVNGDLEHDYGFIIDEIEQTETLSKYFRNIPKTKYVKDGELITPNPDEDVSSYQKVELKEWERDAYIKGLFVVIKALQSKIDKLEEQITKLGGNL